MCKSLMSKGVHGGSIPPPGGFWRLVFWNPRLPNVITRESCGEWYVLEVGERDILSKALKYTMSLKDMDLLPV